MMTKAQALTNRDANLPVFYIDDWNDEVITGKILTVHDKYDATYATLGDLSHESDTYMTLPDTTKRLLSDLFATRAELDRHRAETGPSQ